MTADAPTHYDTRDDGGRTIEFEGWLLGEVSSNTDRRARWTDMRLFRTVEGNYILEIVGATSYTDEDWRYATHVSETPEGIVECLYKIDGDGVRYLTRLARALAEAAAAADPDFAGAFLVEHVA